MSRVTLINYTVLDGKVIAKSVSTELARSGSCPSVGTTGFDTRASYVGCMQGAA